MFWNPTVDLWIFLADKGFHHKAACIDTRLRVLEGLEYAVDQYGRDVMYTSW
jgi:hypothetical protein